MCGWDEGIRFLTQEEQEKLKILQHMEEDTSYVPTKK